MRPLLTKGPILNESAPTSGEYSVLLPLLLLLQLPHLRIPSLLFQ